MFFLKVSDQHAMPVSNTDIDPSELMQPSSSTHATIVRVVNQNSATIVKAIFFFCHKYIVWESNNAGEARGQFWNDSLKSRFTPRIVWVIRVIQSENILPCFLRCDHEDDGCSCNHRAVSPNDILTGINTLSKIFHLLIEKKPIS